MSVRKILAWGILVLPWITVPLIGKKSFIRFLPATTFVDLILSLFSVVADKRKLWKVKNPLFPYSSLDFSFICGLFFVTTLWMFRLAYGNFLKYMFLNIVADYFFVFHVMKFFKKVQFFELKRMTYFQFFCTSVSLAAITYGLQYKIERIITEVENN
ncbi:hypothetical protein NC797_09315 [Aquibacillus sp. 3ASR75-11]|uniref:Uncharacterized protein n=1 Tax=Terrihalobacillus insolitus TaxID=2950438 RepID=A0A9X3WTS8_9BACI|nr:hypothetical protein [Terrihalobacillus insolitus]MDC3415211.1 hypothetical protein [Terrihalobacillus insolitus]MDC3424708.1 hypothetical protein [Terrihalobacillus insolitus]